MASVSRLNADQLADAYMHGFDAWGEGETQDAYLESCRNSQKYASGEWYGLALGDDLVSSLILYRSGFGLPEGSVGIGSVATAERHRRNGYARRMLNEVIPQVCSGSVHTVWLWSDIRPEFYSALGFSQVAHKGNSVLMRYGLNLQIPTVLPDYF